MSDKQYFTHDYLAIEDPKIQEMLSDIGAKGYGIYWAIIETLYQQRGRYPLDAVKHIAHKAYADKKTTMKVVTDYGLFEFDDRFFWSKAQLERQRIRDELIEKKRKGGYARANKAEAQHMQSTSSADAQHMLPKLNEIKLNKTKDNIDANASSSAATEGGELPLEIEKRKIKGTNQVMELWNKIVEETNAPLPKLVVFTEKRRKKIQVRWREFAEVGDPQEVVETLFRRVCESKFFQGDNYKGWSGDFDWLFDKKDNWTHAYEGRYDDRTNNTKKGGYDRLRVEVKSPEDFEGNF